MGNLKPSRITVYLVVAFLLLSLFGITAMERSVAQSRRDNRILGEEIYRLEQENLELEYRISMLGTDASAEELARERLNWVRDGEIVYMDAGQ